VLWFHGTPGGRRQFPLVGRRAAEGLGLRVVLIERPGSGLSDSHEYAAVADFARDMTHVADALGADRLGVVGLSGGGPYALSCAAVPALASRVAAVAVLGGVTPSVGPEATSSGGIDFLRRVTDVISVMRRPFAAAVSAMIVPIIPFDDAKRAISYLSNVELILMPDESHLGGFAAADDVLMFLRSHL
jgi:pimeloyl-ACP methyl ester carboxylesterase